MYLPILKLQWQHSWSLAWVCNSFSHYIIVDVITYPYWWTGPFVQRRCMCTTEFDTVKHCGHLPCSGTNIFLIWFKNKQTKKTESLLTRFNDTQSNYWGQWHFFKIMQILTDKFQRLQGPVTSTHFPLYQRKQWQPEITKQFLLMILL